jgi:hypothetical protein
MNSIEQLVKRLQAGDTAVCRKVSEVEKKPISWLWPGRIARGKVSMIAGDPGWVNLSSPLILPHW